MISVYRAPNQNSRYELRKMIGHISVSYDSHGIIGDFNLETHERSSEKPDEQQRLVQLN